MSLNADLSKRVVVYSEELPWEPSSGLSTQRRLLVSNGGKNECVASIVRYEPGAILSSHPHPQGAEIVVLDGEFADENGVYPVGTYVKTSFSLAYVPRTTTGCTLFIKLRRMDDRDLVRVVVRSSDHGWRPGLVRGLEVLALDQSGTTHTALVRWAADTYFNKHLHPGGEEIFVLQGTFQDEYGNYPCGTWIRNPHMSSHQPYSKAGCLIFVKVGHL